MAVTITKGGKVYTGTTMKEARDKIEADDRKKAEDLREKDKGGTLSRSERIFLKSQTREEERAAVKTLSKSNTQFKAGEISREQLDENVNRALSQSPTLKRAYLEQSGAYVEGNQALFFNTNVDMNKYKSEPAAITESILKNEQSQQSTRERADMIVKNIKIKSALPISTRFLPVDKGPIKLEVQQIPQQQEPSKLRQTWNKINTPIDISKVPVLKDAQRQYYGVMAVMAARDKRLAQKVKGSDNKIISKIGGGLDFLADTGRDFYPAVERELRTPSTWALAAAGDLAGRGIGYVAGKIPGVSKLATNPTAQKVFKGGITALYAGAQAREIKAGRKTFGGVLGETTAYGIAYTFVDPAISKGLNLASTAKQSFKNWNAQRQIKAWEKTLTGDKFRISEGAQGAQRTLTGGSLSDKQLQQNLREINKYKLGFGIEQNTLKPYSNVISSTGQTKLFKNQIVAIDKAGQSFNVKVVNNQPFVYNPKLQKYTEFVSGKYKLFTFPADTSFGRIKGDQLLFGDNVNFPATAYIKETQTLLADPTIPASRAMRVLPAPTTVKPTNIKMSPPVSKTGAVSSFDRSMLVPETLGRSMTAAPNYIFSAGSTPGAPQAPISSDLRLFIPKFGLTPKANFKADIKANIGPITGPLISSRIVQDPKSDIISRSTPIIRPIEIQQPGSKSRSVQLQKAEPVFDQIPEITASPSSPVPPFPSPVAINSFYRPPEIPVQPPAWLFNRDQPKRSFNPFQQKVKQPRSFFPTLKSNILAEVGKTSQFSIISGLGQRLVPKRKKKRSGGFF